MSDFPTLSIEDLFAHLGEDPEVAITKEIEKSIEYEIGSPRMAEQNEMLMQAESVIKRVKKEIENIITITITKTWQRLEEKKKMGGNFANYYVLPRLSKLIARQIIAKINPNPKIENYLYGLIDEATLSIVKDCQRKALAAISQ